MCGEYCVSNWCILWGKVQSRGQRFDKPDKSHLKCDHCGKRGHLKAGCFKLRRYPDWWPGTKDMNLKSKGKFVANQVFMEEDQGTHMINNVMMIEDFGEDNPLALNQSMNADENMQVLLNNLVHLGKDFKTSKVFAVAKEANGLYILDPSSLSFHVNSTNKMPGIDVKQAKSSFVNSLVTGFDSTLWHQRLGHPSDISRLPFPSSTSFSAQVFHLDLWGPYKTKTMSGAAYFLTIVDDCSRFIMKRWLGYRNAEECIISGRVYVNTRTGSADVRLPIFEHPYYLERFRDFDFVLESLNLFPSEAMGISQLKELLHIEIQLLLKNPTHICYRKSPVLCPL
ncbi:hypothetical protein LIER_21182 [Lithospermum erythrorhizon]|uniref:CCHC-type domain-containing protein n=1 Tax=Lithospermum erythrorhizon TaxID=34254 RepID=A0AAV3QS69_LITER